MDNRISDKAGHKSVKTGYYLIDDQGREGSEENFVEYENNHLLVQRRDKNNNLLHESRDECEKYICCKHEQLKDTLDLSIDKKKQRSLADELAEGENSLKRKFDCDSCSSDSSDDTSLPHLCINNKKLHCCYCIETENERQYLNLVKKILEKGTERNDRTGTGTIAIFGELLEFDLREDRLPLLTTRKLSFKSIVEELLWFLRGETDSKILEKRGVNIWRDHSTKEVLTERGFADRRTGDLGPVYGFQWRFAGMEYETCETDYETKTRKQGYDQIEYLLTELRNRPHSRRIIMNSWHVCDISKMALPPCHMSFQLYAEGNEISGLLYSRSADVGLGLPFNIASYAILLHILAKKVGRTAKTLKIIIGDAHIYKNHLEQLRALLERDPFPNPTLTIDEETTNFEWKKYQTSHFHLNNYTSHDPIRMVVSV